MGYLLPQADFSPMEKRYLEQMPTLSWDALISGDWSSQMEDYLSDHVLGRNFFVGINAYVELLMGRQNLKDIWLEDGRLLEAPAQADTQAISRNIAAINALGEKLGQSIDVMVVPSAGWAAGVADYQDTQSLNALYDAAGEYVRCIPVEELYSGNPELYYRTDHHWTSRGAYLSYVAYTAAVGREARQESDFRITTVDGFQGSTYSRSALWLTPSETLELWQGSDLLTVTNGESEETHQGVFYLQRLEEADKYTVFLDGNHSIVRICNPEQEGKLLVIRDSYSNCLGGFLAESYGEVVLVDLRYYRQAVSSLASQEHFDNILVCYSCNNFLTDTNLMLLR